MSLIEQVYKETIDKLKKDQRPLIKLDQEFENELYSNWSTALKDKDLFNIKKVLCLLDNSQNTSGAFEDLFSESLEVIDDSQMIILILGSSSKHMITHPQKESRAVNERFTKAVLSQLSTQDPEVLEWVLRTLEQYGAQSIRFKKDILQVKPGLLSFTNQHRKNAKQIIELLEKRWDTLLGRMK
jgi:hypothetical protein